MRENCPAALKVLVMSGIDRKLKAEKSFIGETALTYMKGFLVLS